MTQSNLYSVSETILLKWLTAHYRNMFPLEAKTITNFDLDLQDGVVLATVIRSHCGKLPSLTGFRQQCSSEEHKQ